MGGGTVIRAIAISAAVVVALLSAMLLALGQEYHSNPWLLSWIPATCCVTNDCCWEIQEREVRSLPDDEWEIRSTGQVRKRTAWSPDGKFYDLGRPVMADAMVAARNHFRPRYR